MRARTVTLRGWKAVAAILVFGGFLGFRWMTARQALDGQGRSALEDWIALEIQRPLLADTTIPLAERGQAVLGASEVTIRSLKARGRLDNLVVRAEIEPDSGFPPGTELVRYYRMQYSSITGWRHRGPASALSFYLTLF